MDKSSTFSPAALGLASGIQSNGDRLNRLERKATRHNSVAPTSRECETGVPALKSDVGSGTEMAEITFHLRIS